MGIKVNGNCYVYGSYIEKVTNYYESGDQKPQGAPAKHKEAHDALCSYVEKVHSLANEQWADKWVCLWESLIGHASLQDKFFAPGRQKDVLFNRNLVANILHQMKGLAVIAKCSASEVAIMLEGSASHSVRAALGEDPCEEVVEIVSKMVDKMR